MTGSNGGTPAEYFRRMWSSSDDPWSQAERWYETRKYDLTVASLPRARYQSAYEPGCGAGFLTERLADRCDALLAHEREPEGVAATARRCARLPNVTVGAGRIPGDWPDAAFDLVVLSEVAYYLDDGDFERMLDAAERSRLAAADLVAVHYRRLVTEHVRLGDDVHASLRARLGPPAISHLENDFVLEVWSALAGERAE